MLVLKVPLESTAMTSAELRLSCLGRPCTSIQVASENTQIVVKKPLSKFENFLARGYEIALKFFPAVHVCRLDNKSIPRMKVLKRELSATAEEVTQHIECNNRISQLIQT